MSDNAKMQMLDNMFMECENLKNQAGAECRIVAEGLKVALDIFNANSTEGLEEIISNIKSFLESANNTMLAINNDLRIIAGDLAELERKFQ